MLSLVRVLRCSKRLISLCLSLLLCVRIAQTSKELTARERSSLNAGWRFKRFTTNPDSLSYDVLKPWILPSGNNFIISGTKHQLPNESAPGSNIEFVQHSFDDSAWENVTLPHDWAIKGPFNAPGIPGEMGRLPVDGVGWYRRNLTIDANNIGKSIFLDIDGSMSYTAVWLNENLVGGWPYGYASFRLDLTPFIQVGDENLLAVRLDNPTNSSRWYPGAGLYRNVWLVAVDPTHVGQHGTFVTTPTVSSETAVVDIVVEIENQGNTTREVDVLTEVHILEPSTKEITGDAVARFPLLSATVPAGNTTPINSSVTISKPMLWGPAPAQTPNLYRAITTVSSRNTVIDTYETTFGIRAVTYDASRGVLINGEAIRVQGTNNHHDQGSLGAAFHVRAAERQLETLQELGGNALRMSHNPPAPELLDLADSMGFMVLDEIFDCWNIAKSPNDFALIFADWHEADLRSFIRRDRNHPSIIAWSFGNEVGEQTTANGSAVAQPLHDIISFEDPTRPATTSMNVAAPNSSFANIMDIKSLNYQGEGVRTNTPTYPLYHATYPNSMLWSSESAATLSSRSIFIFPVVSNNSATEASGFGANDTIMEVSDYDLYAASFGMSPDLVFERHDMFPFAAGEFVWSGFDYLGEPTPYDSSRSSYYGIVDLAGFKKDRFFLYQSHWRPNLPMAHILPHWTWPDRAGQVTPVHVFSSGDEAELFVNGVSAGRINKDEFNYRFRWDDVIYEPGNITVVTYKNGTEWAVDSKRTAGNAASLNITADHTTIQGDAYDLSYITVAVIDENGDIVPQATNAITFSISGPGQILSTNNGDPTDLTSFPSLTRNAFSGLALAIAHADEGSSGELVVSATAHGLEPAKIVLHIE